MIAFICGGCEIQFEIKDEQSIHKESQNCPGCGKLINTSCFDAAKLLVEKNLKSEDKVYVSKDKEIKHSAILTILG